MYRQEYIILAQNIILMSIGAVFFCRDFMGTMTWKQGYDADYINLMNEKLCNWKEDAQKSLAANPYLYNFLTGDNRYVSIENGQLSLLWTNWIKLDS